MDLYTTRRRSISLVANADMASRCGCDCFVVLVLPHVPDLPRKSFLASAVRIQQDRGQTVVSTGPYRYVRHPFYTGALLFFLGSGFLLGSWIGVLLGLLLAGILARRAVREERVLRAGLKGYDAYMAQVKYRIIPHVW